MSKFGEHPVSQVREEMIWLNKALSTVTMIKYTKIEHYLVIDNHSPYRLQMQLLWEF